MRRMEKVLNDLGEFAQLLLWISFANTFWAMLTMPDLLFEALMVSLALKGACFVLLMISAFGQWLIDVVETPNADRLSD
jgi:hypothetical protein